MTARARLWVRREFSLTQLHGFLLWAGLIGFLGALITAAFGWTQELFGFALTGKVGSVTEVSMALAPWQRVAVPLVGSCMAGLILQYGMQLARGRQSTDYMEAVSVGDGFISVRASLVKSASSICTIGSGGSIGREGAMVQLAAMIGSSLGRVLSFPARTRRLLVACGAAAGIASAYNAPLAASVFVSEILLGSIELESMGPIIVSAVVANVTFHQLLGYAPVYQMPMVQLVSPWELLFYLALGLLAGHLAPLFLWLLERTRQLFHKLTVPTFFRLTLGGLVVGALSVSNPQVWGNGYSVVNSILHSPWTWQALLAVLLCKLLATAAMVGSGAVGGVFTPTLFCGAVLGALTGTAVHSVWPTLTGPPSAYAVVGMGAFLGATTHAPLMSILMVFEMTRQYEVVLPLMLAAIVADHMARRYGRGKSIYSESLKRAARSEEPFSLLELAHRDEPLAEPHMKLDALKRCFAQTSFNYLQVVDGQGHWVGVVARKALAEASPESEAAALIGPDCRALKVDMSFNEALEVASQIHSENLPLVEGVDLRYVGLVTKSDLLVAVQRQLRQLDKPTPGVS
ncbi:ClcB-like voltage-gated chloride channel protein [bacterium]|nr:ClcB-like voltage-gated chloride channel protein [bacterium]